MLSFLTSRYTQSVPLLHFTRELSVPVPVPTLEPVCHRRAAFPRSSHDVATLPAMVRTFEQPARSAHPVRQGRAIQLYRFPCVDFLLAKQLYSTTFVWQDKGIARTCENVVEIIGETGNPGRKP